jgi:tRNA threonylcarbamoyladenosine biosynthesis protein TsaE
MQKFISHSYEETLAFAADFAKGLKKGALIAYLGDLGAGKTAFTAGLAKGLGIDADVTSPTFAICNEYHSADNTLYHFDMYRIENWEDLYSTAFFDFLETDAYIAVEWSENIFGALPDDAVIVEIFQAFRKRARSLNSALKGEF